MDHVRSVAVVFLLFLAVFPLPSVQASQEFADSGTTAYDWVQVIENSTVFAYDDSAKQLHIVDLETKIGRAHV